MKVFGIVLLALGSLIILGGFLTNVTVDAGLLDDRQVNNIGLLFTRLNIVILGIGVFVSGAIFNGIGFITEVVSKKSDELFEVILNWDELKEKSGSGFCPQCGKPATFSISDRINGFTTCKYCFKKVKLLNSEVGQ